MKLFERIFRRLLWESQLSGEELSAKIPARIERAIKEKIALAQVKLYGDLTVMFYINRQHLLKQ